MTPSTFLSTDRCPLNIKLNLAKVLTEAAIVQKTYPLIAKDVSWLWRTAYNHAVRGCSEWTGSEQRIAEIFDISREVSVDDVR